MEFKGQVESQQQLQQIEQPHQQQTKQPEPIQSVHVADISKKASILTNPTAQSEFNVQLFSQQQKTNHFESDSDSTASMEETDSFSSSNFSDNKETHDEKATILTPPQTPAQGVFKSLSCVNKTIVNAIIIYIFYINLIFF